MCFFAWKIRKISLMLKMIRILLALAALFAVKAHAQTTIVQRMEGELRGGLSFPLGDYDSRMAPVSGTFGLEIRYNLKGLPWDCGLMFDMATGHMGYRLPDYGWYSSYQSNRSLAFATLGEYNLRQGRRVNPFVGAALGVVSTKVKGEGYGTSMLFAPRVGVEFFRHLRLMAQLNVCGKRYNNLSITIGLVIGGRPKKQ